MRRPQTEAAYAKHASKNPHRAHTNAIPALVLVLLDSLLRNTEEPQPERVHCSRSTRTAESWHALRSIPWRELFHCHRQAGQRLPLDLLFKYVFWSFLHHELVTELFQLTLVDAI